VILLAEHAPPRSPAGWFPSQRDDENEITRTRKRRGLPPTAVRFTNEEASGLAPTAVEVALK